MVPVFVDTGGWIAMAVVRDQFHDHAALYYREMSGKKVSCDYFQLCLS